MGLHKDPDYDFRTLLAMKGIWAGHRASGLRPYWNSGP